MTRFTLRNFSMQKITILSWGFVALSVVGCNTISSHLSSNLSRSEAEAKISEKLPRSMSCCCVDLGPYNPSDSTDSQRSNGADLNALVNGGFVTRGTIQILTGWTFYGSKPIYTTGVTFTPTEKGKRIIVPLVLGSKPLMATIMWPVKTTVEVTGVTQDENTAQVEFLLSMKPGTVGGDATLTETLLKKNVCHSFPEKEPRIASFRKYDDGWRFER